MFWSSKGKRRKSRDLMSGGEKSTGRGPRMAAPALCHHKGTEGATDGWNVGRSGSPEVRNTQAAQDERGLLPACGPTAGSREAATTVYGGGGLRECRAESLCRERYWLAELQGWQAESPVMSTPRKFAHPRRIDSTWGWKNSKQQGADPSSYEAIPSIDCASSIPYNLCFRGSAEIGRQA
jgi:hypothetical protein